ncbi:MAG: winged helix-turn-helix domain-containing protein [Bacteroidaceae bacterium]|nr:winged helix-turn-helix domain-containing protein [Bacteroidaceae bacterium]
MMNEKVGTIAGQIWNALNENGALNTKDLKKVAKVKNDKDLFLGLGWLLREDKVTLTEVEKDFVVALN